jgi:hypothetical protein
MPAGTTMREELGVQLALIERMRDKLGYCLGRFNPTVGDYESCRLPRPLFPVYYALRPLRLMAKYSGLAARRIFS